MTCSLASTTPTIHSDGTTHGSAGQAGGDGGAHVRGRRRGWQWAAGLLLPFLLVVLAARPAAAQTYLPIQPAPQPAPEVEALRIKGEKLRLAGIILVASGVGLVIAGGAMVGYGLGHEVHDQGFGLAGGSLVAFGVGGGAVLGGGILWLVGQNKIWEARERAVSLELAPSPRGSFGGGLALRF
jgi:drug/metabolite transporter (DMT)-like permease